MKLIFNSHLKTLIKTQLRYVRRSGAGSAKVLTKHTEDLKEKQDENENTMSTSTEKSHVEKLFDSLPKRRPVIRDLPDGSRRLKELLENARGFVDLESQEFNERITKGHGPYPYPKVISDIPKFKKFDQSKYSFRPSSVSAKDTSIVLFPGQGTQYVGMGEKLLDYPNVKNLFEIANSILGYDLLNLCLKGPKSELNKTVFCQPAVYVCSLAAVEKLRSFAPEVNFLLNILKV